MKEREGAKRSKSGKKYPDRTSNAVLAKRLPDKTSILTKRLLTKNILSYIQLP